jgi:hypothetical protein
MFYSTRIFKSIGMKGDLPLYSSVVLMVVQLVMTIVSISIVDKAGRRILMIIGTGGMAPFAFFIGIFRILGVS